MKEGAIGFALLFAVHAFAVLVAWLVTKNFGINGHVVVLALLGIIQLIYALPMLAFLLFKKKKPMAAGVLAGAALTAVMSAIGLSR